MILSFLTWSPQVITFSTVLTKVIVYAGIAIIATELLPLTFNLLGLGVGSWIDL